MPNAENQDLVFLDRMSGNERAIEDSEARGQRALVNSTHLPKPEPRDRATFEAMGIVFGDATDDLFCEATLPEGWTKAPTDHSMWSKVCDANGVERIAVFYKAAFYDRKAHMRPVPRYHTDTENKEGNRRSQTQSRGFVTDRATNERVFTGPWVDPIDYSAPFDKDEITEYTAPEAWLKEHRPEHGNAAAYWGDR